MAYHVTDYHTETAGTEIAEVCPYRGSMIAVLRGFSYTPAGTEHNLYAMKALGVTTTASFTDSGATSMELAKIDPGQSTAAEDEDLASGDWVVYETRYGNLEARKVTGVSGATLTIAATGSPVDTGAKVWAFYEPGRAVHKQIRCPASTTTTFDNLMVQSGIPHQDGVEISVAGSGMPMLVVVDNATAAGKLDYCSFEWVAAEEEL